VRGESVKGNQQYDKRKKVFHNDLFIKLIDYYDNPKRFTTIIFSFERNLSTVKVLKAQKCLLALCGGRIYTPLNYVFKNFNKGISRLRIGQCGPKELTNGCKNQLGNLKQQKAVDISNPQKF
jgi:hypothetical protein